MGSSITLTSQAYDFPTGVCGTSGNQSVELYWQPVAGATSYNIQISKVPGFSPLVLENLLAAALPAAGAVESGEMVIPESETGRRLPSGCFARWHRD